MQTAKARNHGIVFLRLSLLLTLLAIAWRILGPIIPTGTSSFTVQDFVVFVCGCIGIVIGVLGLRQSKPAGMSGSIVVLCILSLSANGLILFFTSFDWLNPPEVKGVVQKIGDDYIIIDVDKDYLPEYSTAHLPDDSSTDLMAGISNRTILYERHGNWGWQKKAVNIGNLQQGQRIQIKYNGLRFLTGDIIEAGEIVILNP